MKVKIEVVRVSEKCGRGYKVGDIFIFEKGEIIPQNNEIKKQCLHVFHPGVGLERFFAGERPLYFSCIDAGYGKGNANVIFKASEDESL